MHSIEQNIKSMERPFVHLCLSMYKTAISVTDQFLSILERSFFVPSMRRSFFKQLNHKLQIRMHNHQWSATCTVQHFRWVKWSRDPWRYAMTPSIFEAPYSRKHARWSLDHNGPPIVNPTLQDKWLKCMITMSLLVLLHCCCCYTQMTTTVDL